MRAQVVKNTENVQGMKAMEERSAPIMSFATLDGQRRLCAPGVGYPGAPIQNRPLPIRPDEEEIYAEADSFSSGTASPPPSAAGLTYANRDAAYANGGDSGYPDGDDSGATYTNGSDSGDTTAAAAAGGTVTVNGMALL